MSNFKNLIDYAAASNAVGFRQEFAKTMNDQMAQMIQIKFPAQNTKSVNEETDDEKKM